MFESLSEVEIGKCELAGVTVNSMACPPIEVKHIWGHQTPIQQVLDPFQTCILKFWYSLRVL